MLLDQFLPDKNLKISEFSSQSKRKIMQYNIKLSTATYYKVCLLDAFSSITYVPVVFHTAKFELFIRLHNCISVIKEFINMVK